MPAKLIALYKRPLDTAHFDKYYFESHLPVAKTVPGLRRYTVNAGPIASPQGPAAYHLVAELHFDSLGDVAKALASPEGQRTGADLANFASGGVELLVMETREV